MNTNGHGAGESAGLSAGVVLNPWTVMMEFMLIPLCCVVDGILEHQKDGHLIQI